MTKSRTVEVNVTQSTLVGQTAQVTADNAASQAGSADSAALIAQSMANAAKADADSNYNYANSEIAVQSTATAKAQSTADNAFSQAQLVGSQANSAIAVQSTATAKAQSTADNAFSQATTALDTGKVTSQAVIDLKDGSKLTIADLENGLATKVANSEYASYKVQTASQIAQKVDNGAFSAYKTQTADLIAQKVANSDFSAYQATTAKSIESKVESSDFNTYKTQTANLIDDKVSSSEYASDKTQTASEIADRVSNSAFSTYQTQTASQIAQKVDNGAFSAYQSTTADLIASKVATKDFSAYQATTAKAISSKVESSDFNTYKTQTAGMIASKVSTVDFNNLKISNRNLALGTATPFTMTGNGSTNNAVDMYSTSGTIAKGTTLTVTFDITSTKSEGTYYIQFTGGTWQDVMGSRQSLVSGTQHHSYTFTTTDNFSDGLQLRLDNATAKVTVSNFIISESSKEVSWTPAPEDQATQSQITQLSHDINLRVTKGDLIDQINIQAGNTLISSSGQLTLAADTIYFDTKKPVIIPSANITGTLTGKTINASTINGTTFHGGDMISNSNNTAGYYPMTITPDGAYKSTYFDSRVALRASVQSGAIIYDYRSMFPDGNGKYIYSSTTIHGQGITIDSGHTDTKDSTFNGYRTGGSYISLTPSAGLLLHGSDANINFGGHLKDNEFDEGMYMNPYGNIIGKSASDYWQVSKQGTDNTGGGVTARFGIDTGDKGTINFYRPLFVDEIGGFTSSNGHALFIHGDDNGTSGSTGQMIFRKDGRSAQVVSASIYNRTYSSGSTVTVTSYGTLGRITSASKYKLDITKETSISPANKLLSIDMSSWIDKSSAEQLSDSKTNGTDLSEPEMNVFRHYGLIAEDLIKAGLNEFVIKGDNGQAEGIEYDRLWTVLIPKIRQLSNDQIQNKMTIAKLGSEIEELKQGR
ncbi:phage tail protein [Lactiplantibacillus plantarum]|nr:phage tail protein [Lactiplantibacillus plantarum]